mgnify:CR=1 FL=1
MTTQPENGRGKPPPRTEEELKEFKEFRLTSFAIDHSTSVILLFFIVAVAVIVQLDPEVRPDHLAAIAEDGRVSVDGARRILRVAGDQPFEVRHQSGRRHPVQFRTRPARVVLWPISLMKPTASSGVQSALCAYTAAGFFNW